MTRRPPLRVALLAVYGLLLLVMLGGAALAGRETNPVQHVNVPAYCDTATMTGCVNEVVEAQGAVIVSNACTRSGKGWACDLEVQGLYGPSCYAVSIRRAREGFPLIETAAEKACA